MSVANHRCAFRPLRGGTLIFQPDNHQAGTLGMALTSDGDGRWLLTCFHVLARPNGTIVASDRLHQPDATKGVIATLANVVSDARLDCAAVQIALPVSDEILGLGRPTPAAPPVVGARVLKSGWKTGVSEGRVQAVAGTDVTLSACPTTLRTTYWPAPATRAQCGSMPQPWHPSHCTNAKPRWERISRSRPTFERFSRLSNCATCEPPHETSSAIQPRYFRWNAAGSASRSARHEPACTSRLRRSRVAFANEPWLRLRIPLAATPTPLRPLGTRGHEASSRRRMNVRISRNTSSSFDRNT